MTEAQMKAAIAKGVQAAIEEWTAAHPPKRKFVPDPPDPPEGVASIEEPDGSVRIVYFDDDNV